MREPAAVEPVPPHDSDAGRRARSDPAATVRPVALRGGRVLDVRGRAWVDADVVLAGGRVVAVERAAAAPAGATTLDAGGLLVTPGLLDAQVNGAAGADLTRAPDRLPEVAAALLRRGVTAFVPTVVSSPAGTVERLLRAVTALSTDTGAQPAAHVVGVHAEGPFLAPTRRGAHRSEHLCAPDLSLVAGWSRDAGVVAVTLAPELDGALDVVRALTARGVVVWLGHTAATYEQVLAAAAAGARAVTHLFNAMPPLLHRDPGPVGAVLGNPSGDAGLVAGVVVDGRHVHPAVVRTAWRALGPARFLLVSDATAALGRPDGPTVLGDQEVVVAGGTVRLAAAPGTLAGSAVGLDDCVRTLVEVTGCAPADAFAAATLTPADLLDRPDLGRLEPGARADVAVWTPDLRLQAVVAGGRPVDVAGEVPDARVRR